MLSFGKLTPVLTSSTFQSVTNSKSDRGAAQRRHRRRVRHRNWGRSRT